MLTNLLPPSAAAIGGVDPFGARLQPGAGAAFVVLATFLVSFLLIRTSARLTRSVSWWPGGLEAGGVHVHHLVWGIGLMLLCGFLAFAAPLEAPWWHLVAIGFGIGAGFTLDEFALWLRLEDVYWAEEGRLSFDAVVCTLAFGALAAIGTRPFGLDDPGSIAGAIAAVALIAALAGVCFAKGRGLLGVIGLFVPLVAVFGAVRLGHPTSLWARWRYDDARRARAAHRFGWDRPLPRARRRAADLIVGAPTGAGEADRMARRAA
jgi:hypothetical protein